MRLLFTPPQAGRWHGQGVGRGCYGPGRPGTLGSDSLGEAVCVPRVGGARSGSATSPPGEDAPGVGAAQKPVSALRRSDLLGTSPEGAHESTHAG